MAKQLKPGRNVECFVLNIKPPEQNSAPSASAQNDLGLVEASVIDAIKLEFKDIFSPPHRQTGATGT